MGTDIHGVFQRHDGSQWVDIESNYEQWRNYQLFAVLANVRNGFGFAGTPTGEAVKPISEPRGLPRDFEGGTDHESLQIWMGYHSHSWLTGEEMLDWYEAAPEVCQTGILERSVYEAWDGKSKPSTYCADISGARVIVVNDNQIEKDQKPSWTHIRCNWSSDLKRELVYFFDEVKRLVGQRGRIRFVFGFDS